MKGACCIRKKAGFIPLEPVLQFPWDSFCCILLNGNLTLAFHCKIQRIGNETQTVGFVVQGFGLFNVLCLGDGYPWPQGGLDKSARPGAVAFVHHGFCVVGVGGYGNACGAAQVQIPEFVAGGDGRKQHIFGIVAVFVTAKGGV